VARPADPAIRNRLTRKAASYLLEHGVADLSLRPLAKALGTSARMLIYHFGSREALILAALAEINTRQDARISAWYAGRRTPPSLSDFLLWLCDQYSTKQARQMGQMALELWVLALRDPTSYPGVFTTPLDYWEQLSARSPAKPDPTEATLLLAAVRGFLIDLAATGDSRRVQRAIELLATMLKRRGR
jgi:AcrR family transcriptional regulator